MGRGAPRGRQHPKSTAFSPDKPVRASVVLPPGDEVRTAYEELVTTMGISGAEVVRTALLELHAQKKKTRRSASVEGGRLIEPAS